MSILSSGICTDNGRINVFILPNDIYIFLLIHWIERRRRERIPLSRTVTSTGKQSIMRQANLEPSHGTVTEHARFVQKIASCETSRGRRRDPIRFESSNFSSFIQKGSRKNVSIIGADIYRPCPVIIQFLISLS